MKVTINSVNRYEAAMDEIFEQFAEVEIEMTAEREAQEIEEFSDMIFEELNRDLNPPSRN
ncbi:hypothetical protein [Cytobacillus gottheilii]|uniref:hypothetical protein n=1 Tax=Cytobacillus gottheilii TaxID=859144 RepID=UPI0009B9C29E|nr:hypothetical protein [Cytobacillus gottheilii]